MMRFLILAAVLGMAVPASATQIDLSASTCKQFLEGEKDDITLTLAWLDAYYKPEDAPAIIDTEKFVANAQKLAEYCVANPDTGLITATDSLFGPDAQ